jgi:hypothetical protein
MSDIVRRIQLRIGDYYRISQHFPLDSQIKYWIDAAKSAHSRQS